MALTKNKILKISEPVEQIYMDCSSRLLVNLCRHFASDKSMATAEWEIKKLSELGGLTEESIDIITDTTRKTPEAVKTAVANALDIELDDVDKIINKSADAGNIQSAATTWRASEAVQSVVSNLTEQATEDTNIVRTTMLQSTRENFVNAVQRVAEIEYQLLAELAVDQAFKASQNALDTAALSVATGAEARTEAVRRVIKELAEEGITGFIDSSGRHWTPEAYVNMVTRTTVHNAAIQGQKTRAADIGVYTFQVSSHTGARPLCAPYQGKFYSWDGTSGTIKDIEGNSYRYESINNTSYGEAAGLFGINCGHRPLTFIDGYGTPRYEPLEDEEQNNKDYELTQKQRYYERQIRKDKTEAIAYDAANDKEAFAKKAMQISEKSAKYKVFCEENGLTARPERTQVIGYNKNVSGKAVQVKKFRDTINGTI